LGDYIEKANNFKEKFQFHKAIKLLEEINIEEQNPYYFRLKAQCYYQDLKLPTTKRFSKALKLLEIKDDDKPQETLRLKGAVHKRKYDYNRDIKELYQAISFYEKASENKQEDMGYGAGNAVYLYYLLLSELGNTLSKEIKEEYQKRVDTIANRAIDELQSSENLNEWNYASLSSLYLAIEKFDESKKYLKKYKNSNDFDRQQFVTVEQMVKLFDVLPTKHEEKELEDVLSVYDNAKSIIKSVRIGKIGLALSGGGFRASLFHIGVLKRLSELDMLRHIEVISTVSGGSILGMYYYLELKKLLEKNENDTLGQQDYIEMVNRIEKNFSESLKSNLRISAFLKCPRTSLTEKLGMLYQEKLYDAIDTKTTLMNQLSIEPNVDGKKITNYLPEFQNFELKNNIPRIIINSTLLNNGHNWQFTAHGMGENEYMSDLAVNNNKIYSFKKYTKEEKVSIGTAIASSSAVPILFDPISLTVNNETVKLSDGGLYDNMGLSSLIADECSHIIVSDGSGQLKVHKDPSTFRLDVLGRVTEVLMNRTREGEYKMAKSLKELGVLNGLAIFHMEAESSMDKELQEKLSLVRTDLDAFHELESEALVYAGYKICSHWFTHEGKVNGWKLFKLDVEESNNFTQFEKKVINDKEEVFKLLDTSSKVLMKLPTLLFKNSFGLLLGAILVMALGYFYPWYLAVGVGVILLLILLPVKSIFKLVFSKGVSLFVMPFSWVYVLGLNRFYIYLGKLNGKY
jgi:predicted acylesterase/phospholipase RssA